jgi:GT2 family glycosyltransferase
VTEKPAVSSTAPLASIIIVEYRTADYIGECLASLEASELARDRFEVIVVDNDSPTPIGHLRERFPHVRWVKSRRNLGFAGGCALGLERAGAPIVVTVNPDCVVSPDWLTRMLEAFEDPRAGVVGCKILYPGTRILQHAGGKVFANGRSEHRGRDEQDHGQYDQTREVDYVCGAAIAVRRATIDDVGFLSPAYFPAYYEETELCVRARRAGWKVLYTPHAVVEHHESVASGGAMSETFLQRYHESRMRFIYRNTGPKELLSEFLPAEIAWVSRMGHHERWICARSYASALVTAWRETRGTPRPGDVIEDVPAAPVSLRRRSFARSAELLSLSEAHSRPTPRSPAGDDGAAPTGPAVAVSSPRRTKRRGTAPRSAPAPQSENPSANLPSAAQTYAPLLPGARVPGAVIPGAVIPGAVIPGAVIPGTVIPGTVIPGTVIPGTVIPGARVPGTVIPGVQASGAQASGAQASGAQASGARAALGSGARASARRSSRLRETES